MRSSTLEKLPSGGRAKSRKNSTRLRHLLRYCGVFGNCTTITEMGLFQRVLRMFIKVFLSVIEVLNLLHGKRLWDIPKIKWVLVLRILLKVISATHGSLTPLEKVWGRQPWHSPTGNRQESCSYAFPIIGNLQPQRLIYCLEYEIGPSPVGHQKWSKFEKLCTTTTKYPQLGL